MSGYQVCCNQYKSSFFKEFSHLQHEEEFVDLTLAADGYLVKVHKNVIAVASPYLKEMLKSSASQSPVIFLHKVNHVILKYLLEYIYQGEVNVPVGILKEFVEVAKSLHINGINNVDLKQLPKSGRKTIVEPENKRPYNKVAAHITINNVNDNHSLEVQKCNEIETINIDSDFIDGVEEFQTADYIVDNVEHPLEKRPINTVTLPTLITEENREISEYSWSKKESLLHSSRDNTNNSGSILIQNKHPPENRPFNTLTLPTLITEENCEISEYLLSKNESWLQSSKHDTNNFESILIQNKHPPENRPINTVTLPTLITEENCEISEYLLSKNESLLQSSKHDTNNFESILIQNKHPPENRPINTVTLPTLITEENSEISEYSLSKNESLLQSSRDNLKNSQSILIQNVDHKGKKLEIVIDATNSTFNVTGPTLNVIENTEDITKDTYINTQNAIDDPDNEITHNAEDLKKLNSENKIIEEEDGMDYDNFFNTSIQVQPLTQTEAITNLDSLNNIELDKVDMNDLRGMAQYTITQRGNTQLILNRYMYCCQFESRRGLRTRWRCIDYRRSRCPAMIDMENEKILKRTGAHGHAFHDNKIYKKHRKGLIFNTLQIAKEAYVQNPMQFVD